MKPLLRNKSIITGKDTLEHLYTYEKFPVFISYKNQGEQRSDILEDMRFFIDADSGIIQLDNVLPLDIVYETQHSVGLGTVWENHYNSFVQFIREYHPVHVLEIGGGNGIVAKLYTRNKKDVTWTIVEPLPLCNQTKKIKILKKWFDKDFTYDKKIDAIIHSHVLEHMYYPQEFMKQVYELLNIGGRHIFSVPNLSVWLQKKYINTINFEHTIFLTEYFIDFLLQTNGFTILKKEYYLDHSIFYATEKVKEKKQIKLISQYAENKKIFTEFVLYYKQLITAMNKEIVQTKYDVYLFGAHIFSQFLLNFGLETKKIKGILDNADIKQNKRLYGTSLFVFPPEIITGDKPVIVILKASAYQEEIKNQLVLLNKNVIILE